MKRKTPLRSHPKATPTPRPAEHERALSTWCEVQLPGCDGRAVHLHHRKRRTQGGDDSRENRISVCLACHEWIHRHPSQAYAKGLLVEHWLDPASVAISVGPGVLSMLVEDVE